MKLCNIISHYPSVDGITHYYNKISEHWKSMLDEVRVVSAKHSIETSGHFHWEHGHGKAKLVKYLRELEPDLVVIHGMFNIYAYRVSRICRLLNIPYISYPHDPYSRVVFGKNRWRKWAYWHLFEKRFLKDSIGVQLISLDQQSDLERLGVDKKSIVVPHGVPETVNEIVRDQTVISEEQRVIHLVYLGRIDFHHKGVDILIETIQSLDSRDNIKLDIIGKGEDIEMMIEGCDRIHYLGYDGRKSVDILSCYDAVIMPSRFDGFGLVGYEAMAAGVPVLVSNKAGVSRVVEQEGAGLLFNPTVAGLTQVICDFVDNIKEAKQMGECGLDYILRSPGWKEVAKSTLQEYMKLLKI